MGRILFSYIRCMIFNFELVLYFISSVLKVLGVFKLCINQGTRRIDMLQIYIFNPNTIALA